MGTDLKRRSILTGLAAGTAIGTSGLLRASNATHLPLPASGKSASDMATNEAFWREVASYYDRTEGVVNLEHGFWGKMAHPVQSAYIEATRMVNAQNSYYARKQWPEDLSSATRRVAQALGAHEDEIVITRNATEAAQNLVLQYKRLEPGDAVLYADIDYPYFKPIMRYLEKDRGVKVVDIKLPPMVSGDEVRARYVEAFDENPNLKLMLLTHASNQHGLVIPVAQITAEARRRGIDVICDTAQSWGLLNYRIGDLDVDWACFNLHKWIGAPIGVGALYMRRGSLHKITPFPGEEDPDNTRVNKRIHSGTVNFAGILAVPAALDFHQALGPANKEARLRHLRSLWTSPALGMPHIEVLGGANETDWSGIGSFRLQGQASAEQAQHLQQRLEMEFGLFTVVRKGLASGACVRITPQVFNSADDINRLVSALEQLKA
jgi:selenocysteine lyase/cysteine desulfurase